MITAVRETSTAPPVLVTGKATAIELREDDGTLVRLIMFMKDDASVMFTTLGDPDFEQNCAQVGIPLKVDPAAFQKEGAGIKSMHRIISDGCRLRGGEEVEEVLEATRNEIAKLYGYWPQGKNAKIHVKVEVEYGDG